MVVGQVFEEKEEADYWEIADRREMSNAKELEISVLTRNESQVTDVEAIIIRRQDYSIRNDASLSTDSLVVR